MMLETWKWEIIKALVARGPSYPLGLMALAYPFGLREGGRTAEEMREAKKADYLRVRLQELIDEGLVMQMDGGKVDLSQAGWEIYAANRGQSPSISS